MSINKGVVINGRFLTQSLSGVQRFAYEITDRLVKAIPIKILVPNASLNSEYIVKGWDIIKLGNYKGQIWEQLELPYILRKYQNPLLLNFCNTAPLLYKQNVITIHDLAFLEHRWHSKAFRTFYKFMIPKLVNEARQIFTVSEFSRSEIGRILKMDTRSIEIIPNAVDHIRPTTYYTKHKQKIVLAVGSLDPRKNLVGTIKGFLRSRAPEMGYKLLIVGGKSKNFAFDNNIINNSSSSNIEFLGFVTDENLKKLYHEAEIFLYPSLYEGFGIPPLEAMAFNCCVITSKVASLPEVCGKAAYYVDPLDYNSISRALDNVILNPDIKLSIIKNCGIQSSQYSWQASANKVLNSLSLSIKAINNFAQ